MEFKEGYSLPGRGIGMVSVHPRSRSKGYMKALMNMALEDMKNDGMVFSCLGGQRQRYEYFGYTPAGTNYQFSFNESNIIHTLGREWKSSLKITIVNIDDTKILDNIMEIHESKNARYYRSRERFFDILASWHAVIFAITEGECFKGYFVCKPNSYEIMEINLIEPSRMCEAIGLLLRFRREKNDLESVNVAAGPHEIEKIAILSRFAEHYRQDAAYQFNVFDFKQLAEPLMKIRAKQKILAEGSFVLKIEGPLGGTYKLTSQGGQAGIIETTAPPDLILDTLEAVRFFFSPVTAVTNQKIRESLFLQSLLPLPLFFEYIDGI